MTLLSIIQDASDELSLPQPSSVIGNTEDEVVKLLRYANRCGLKLRDKVVFQALRKEHTFTALATETQTGILPSDFNRFIPETFWDRTNVRLLTGPVGPVEWQGLKANSYDDEKKKFIHRGDSVLVIPTFDGGESLAFEYVSDNWCESSGGTGQTAWAADTDVGLIDEELLTLGVVYMHLVAEEQATAAVALQAFNDYLDDILDNDQPLPGIPVVADIFGTAARHFDGAPPISGNSAILD